MVIPAKRDFSSADVSYLIKRDGRVIRINGEVYDKDDNPVLYSDVHPDNPYIQKYGTDVEYVHLPLNEVIGDGVQVDHIINYKSDVETRDLDKCELTSSGFNNWKNDREAVYADAVLSEIQLRKEQLSDDNS